MATSRYTNSAKLFGQKFPPGVHTMTAVYQFVKELTAGQNGYARDPVLQPDMHIDDPRERQASILKKLNSAGRDANIRITDQKDGNIYVQSFSQYAVDDASVNREVEKVERLGKAADKKAKALEGLEGLSENDAEKAAIRKEALTKLAEEAREAAQASREHNFLAIAKHIGISADQARRLLPNMEEYMGTTKKR